ncbi:hypothetical protein HK098_002370 [Nowakowskiella sp. JEL0407]|nr:hypothetical protein HK098_002370 [Nowakowskiella sp. JEL0407]
MSDPLMYLAAIAAAQENEPNATVPMSSSNASTTPPFSPSSTSLMSLASPASSVPSRDDDRPSALQSTTSINLDAILALESQRNLALESVLDDFKKRFAAVQLQPNLGILAQSGQLQQATVQKLLSTATPFNVPNNTTPDFESVRLLASPLLQLLSSQHQTQQRQIGSLDWMSQIAMAASQGAEAITQQVLLHQLQQINAQKNIQPQTNNPGKRTGTNKEEEAEDGEEGAKTYQCPTCPRSFSRMYNLKSHVRSHENHRPYECTECGARFTRNHDLTRHQKIHTKEKPYQCTCCGRQFARRDALKRHSKLDELGRRVHCFPSLNVEAFVNQQSLAALNQLNANRKSDGFIGVGNANRLDETVNIAR